MCPCQDEQGPTLVTRAARTGGPPKGQRGAGPRNGGRRPQNRTGANPRTDFQVPYAVFF